MYLAVLNNVKIGVYLRPNASTPGYTPWRSECIHPQKDLSNNINSNVIIVKNWKQYKISSTEGWIINCGNASQQ